MDFLLDRPPHLGDLPRFQHPNDITDFPKPLSNVGGHRRGYAKCLMDPDEIIVHREAAYFLSDGKVYGRKLEVSIEADVAEGSF
jgi:hypothetical protein